MARNMVQVGTTLTFTPVPTGGVKSGDPILIGSAFGVCQTDAPEGSNVEADVEGVYALPKAAGAVTFGQKLYVTGAGVITTTATGNTLVGYAAAPASAGDAAVHVKLTP